MLGNRMNMFPNWPPADWSPNASFGRLGAAHPELNTATLDHVFRTVVSWAPAIQEYGERMEGDMQNLENGEQNPLLEILPSLTRVAPTLQIWGSELAGTLPVSDGQGRVMHDVVKMLKYLRASWYAGSTHQLDLVMHHAVVAALPPSMAAGILKSLSAPGKNPSKWSLKRYRLALDIAYLFVSQEVLQFLKPRVCWRSNWGWVLFYVDGRCVVVSGQYFCCAFAFRTGIWLWSLLAPNCGRVDVYCAGLPF